MSRLSPIRIMAAATAGVVAGALLVAFIGVSNVGYTDGIDLTVKAALAAVLALSVTGIILAVGRKEPSPDESRTESCAACGGDVYHEWRLCPHCGAWLHQK